LRYFLLITLLALPISARAGGTDPVQAKAVCANLNDPAPRRACLATVKDGKFDPALAGICNGMSEADPTTACIKAIKNKIYQPGAIAQCQRLSTEEAIGECLGVVGNKGFTAYEIQSCGTSTGDDQMIACFKKAGASGAEAVARANAAPRIDPKDPYSWRSCERPDLERVTMPFDANDKFVAPCAPDTLYSWQFPGAVAKLAALAKKDPSHVFPVPYLYTWRTPLGTFGYATDLVRIKLKKDVKFAYVAADARQCPIDEAADKYTVYVSYLGATNSLAGWSEYLLCSSGPVASWSHDTPEGLKEMNAERSWVQTHTSKDWDSIWRGGPDDTNAPIARSSK
jgi:hypothetical protein